MELLLLDITNFATSKNEPLSIPFCLLTVPRATSDTDSSTDFALWRHLTWILLKKWAHVHSYTHTAPTLKSNAHFYKCCSYRRFVAGARSLSACVTPGRLRHQKSSTIQISLVIEIVKTITLVSSNSLWSLSALVFSKSRLCSSSLMRACSSLVCVC